MVCEPAQSRRAPAFQADAFQEDAVQADAVQAENGGDQIDSMFAVEVRLLSGLLDETIRRLAGSEKLALIAEIRGAARDLRARPSADDARRLVEHIAQLSV